jgi:hypothetical protein
VTALALVKYLQQIVPNPQNNIKSLSFEFQSNLWKLEETSRSGRKEGGEICSISRCTVKTKHLTSIPLLKIFI